MPTHRFKIGETVFVGVARHLNFPGGAYVVTAKLPERDGELSRRMKLGGYMEQLSLRLRGDAQ